MRLLPPLPERQVSSSDLPAWILVFVGLDPLQFHKDLVMPPPISAFKMSRCGPGCKQLLYSVCRMGLLLYPRPSGYLELVRGQPQPTGGRTTCPGRYPRVPSRTVIVPMHRPTASIVPGKQALLLLRSNLLPPPLRPSGPQDPSCLLHWPCSTL